MDDPIELKALIWLNVKTLMERKYGKAVLTRLGVDTGIAPAGAQRLQGKKEVGPTILYKVAKFFEVHPWQLLAPQLGESMKLSPPELEAVRKLRDPMQPKGQPAPPPLPPPEPRSAFLSNKEGKRRHASKKAAAKKKKAP